MAYYVGLSISCIGYPMAYLGLEVIFTSLRCEMVSTCFFWMSRKNGILLPTNKAISKRGMARSILVAYFIRPRDIVEWTSVVSKKEVFSQWKNISRATFWSRSIPRILRILDLVNNTKPSNLVLGWRF